MEPTCGLVNPNMYPTSFGDPKAYEDEE